MVIDTSALLAILLAEPEAEPFARAIAGDPRRLVSSVSAFEASIVIRTRKGPAGVRELDLLIHSAAMSIVSFDEEQVQIARTAYESYGKGRHREVAASRSLEPRGLCQLCAGPDLWRTVAVQG